MDLCKLRTFVTVTQIRTRVYGWPSTIAVFQYFGFDSLMASRFRTCEKLTYVIILVLDKDGKHMNHVNNDPRGLPPDSIKFVNPFISRKPGIIKWNAQHCRRAGANPLRVYARA